MRLNELRQMERERVERHGKMLALVMALGFNTAGWNTAAPEMPPPSLAAQTTSCGGNVSTTQPAN
ncbi:MAG TPA: hypothetical protein VJ837_01680 [Candidatus Paceibacterota bacterium]|nr:hypothetical protein [Candidatus Paceibacterota bacterium]